MRTYEVNRRAALFVTLLSLGLIGIGTRLAELQLQEHDIFAQMAMSQRLHGVRLDPPRGDIVDRNGQQLVTNRSAYRLQLLFPSYVENGEPNHALLVRLASLLHLDSARLEVLAHEQIRQQLFYEPLPIKDDLSTDEVSLLVELRTSMPGLYIDSHPVRQYRADNLAAHVVGHVGTVESQAEADQLGPSYRPGDLIGRMGLETQYDSVLRGVPGHESLEIDATFRPTGRTIAREPAKAGASLRTTLDLDLQQTVQVALVNTLHYVSTHPDFNGVFFPQANAGAVVVMDIHTGAILAMASYPTFDPNNVAAGGAFFNRAISGEYLPGSTWKMLTGASALENGVVGPHDHVLCTGIYDKLEPKLDWKLDGHGPVDIVSALANSCNIYFYEMGYRLGVDKLAATAKEFGFGQKLGIDLPDESSGWIPDEKRRQADENAGAWNGGKLLSAAIGQGPTTTPVQLARYASVLANGGLLVKPHLVSGLINENGKLLRDLTPPPDGRIGLQPDYLQYLVNGMKAVTEWGTSSNAFDGLPFKVAGKTGTAEVQGASACAGTAMCQYGVYVAFAPADKPEIAVAVVGERAGHGDSMNPVARAALAKYFHVNLAADDPLYALGILPRLTPVSAPTPSFPPRQWNDDHYRKFIQR